MSTEAQDAVTFTFLRGKARIRHRCGRLLPQMPDVVQLTAGNNTVAVYICRACRTQVTAQSERTHWLEQGRYSAPPGTEAAQDALRGEDHGG